jgi:hypothetical protein
MARTRLVVASLLLAVSACQPSIAQPNDDDAKRLRPFIERQMKQEFDAGIADFMKLALSNNPHFLDKQDHEVELAKDAVKGLFYNKAYHLYVCAKSIGVGWRVLSDDEWKKVQLCYDQHNKEMLKGIKIMTQYTSLLASKAAKEEECELKARLFDAELDFPPFDFLRRSDGADKLFDFAVMTACFLSINQ